MEKIKSSRITKATVVALAISILSASVYSSNEGAEQLPTASKSSATSNIDIDGNEEFDALTDGLLILRSMFGLTDSPLITGAVAGDALYVDAEDIQSRIEGLGNRLDIDNDGNIDALTDGLVTLRYLFGLTGDPLISGVIATGAGRVTAEDIEAYMAVLTSLDTEPPVFTSQETFTAPENQTAIGTVTATDANSPSIAFSISGSELSITSDGVLSFASAPDYETKTSYTATVTASDGTNLTTQAIVVSVSDVDEAPIMGVLNYTADENQTSIGSVVATDPEGEAVSLSVSGSELLITSDGVLTFASAPDYETKSSYTATVTATDGTNSTDQSVTVTVTDVDDVAPVFTSSATFSAAENQTAIDTVTATDVDTDNSSISFSVSGSELLITSAGVLTFASSPDYETKTSYSATVSATDGANSTKQDITVNVTNVNDIAPVFTSTNNFSVVEGQTAIGTVTATDAEGDDITFTISGTELAITSEGVLTFVSAPDYETKSSYSATLTASDGVNQTNQNITISITFDYEYPDHWDQYQ
ncbi:cadherin repeat domain-containing protein, partial [Porticoccaceae bacterium]|nr:cadherin repeat domain-containing protein [Porticoccaceae bacterium]